MANSVYPINKGINRPITFRGLKAQYIWYLGGCILALLILFAVLYIIGINPFICTGFVLLTGAVAVLRIYSLSNKYGTHGMMKKRAQRQVPQTVKARSRKTFKKQCYGKTSR